MTNKCKGFVDENIGLVRSCVGRYIGKGIEYDDLFQAACLGLVKAASGYDSARGTKFS
ncbi:MAG: flagellar biosynthesis protein FliA, partial [Clostridia bacterium]|nr:flagellar biosynthesis protein FliA [Clostridia bacterium]